MTVNLVVKVPEELRRRARAVAALRGETIADVVRTRLEEYIREAQSGELVTPAKHRQRVVSLPLRLEGEPLSELLHEVRGE